MQQNKLQINHFFGENLHCICYFQGKIPIAWYASVVTFFNRRHFLYSYIKDKGKQNIATLLLMTSEFLILCWLVDKDHVSEYYPYLSHGRSLEIPREQEESRKLKL